MAIEADQVKTCGVCGASIYPEHVKKGLAEDWKGRLLCSHCLREKRDADTAVLDVPIAMVEEDDVGLLDDGTESGDRREATAIRSFGGGPVGMSESMAGMDVTDLTRPVMTESPYATRCRTFHSKLTDPAMKHMNDQINGWVDSHEDVVIKFATSSIGVIEGKHTDPHLIMTLFY